MFNLPQELVFALIFGAVLLVQFLMKWLRRQSVPTEADADADAEFEPEPEPESGTLAQTPPVDELPPPMLVPPARPSPAVPRAGPAPATRASRRFSRSALMTNRRAVQDAVVIATILGPCRAYRPHGVE